MLGEFQYERHTPTDGEKKIMAFLERRRKQMDTSYRQSLIEMAAWATKEYDAIPQTRINNLDLFKTGLSRAVVNHRLVMLYDNPAEAVYYATEDTDKYKVEYIKQLDNYDKKISRFDATYQELEREANIKGISIGMLEWKEDFDGDTTVGDFCTSVRPIDIKNFYWDEAGIYLNGNSPYTCNDVAFGEVISMTRFRDYYCSKDFKNTKAVLPNIERPTDEVWNADWEEGRYSTDGDYVYVYTYKCKKFHENGKFTDKEFIVANGQVLYEGEMREPVLRNTEKWLPFFKIIGIPTGGFGGLGIPAIIRHPQEALDRMVTMAEAQAELAVNPVLFYQTTGELLPDQIDYFSGAAYPYKGTGNGITNDMMFLQQPDITAGAQYIINKMVEFITITTGVDIQSLLDTRSSELAIQTQNKKDIQEKILNMTVLWNETHGWSDMARLRIAYLQEYYPTIRIQRILGANGVVSDDEPSYPKIRVNDYIVKKSFSNGESVQMLEKKAGAYSSISIKPEEIRFPLDVQIVSSQLMTGVDTIKQNKWEKMLDGLARVPGVEEIIDTSKVARGTVKFAGFKSSEVLHDRLSEATDDTHPARNEFKAILVSEYIPFEAIMPEKYEPEEYMYIFRDMMKLPEFKKASQVVKKQIFERLQFHIINFVDPLFKEKQKRETDMVAHEQAENDMAMGNTLKPTGDSSQPTSLSSQVKSDAAKIGDNTKKMK